MSGDYTSEDTELLREIRDLLLEGVKLKRAQLNELFRDHKHVWPIGIEPHPPCFICGKIFDGPAAILHLGHEAEQDAHGARDTTLVTPPEEKPYFCERCQTRTYKVHIHTEIP